MEEIIVRIDPDRKDLQQRGVFDWPTWTCEPSEFPWEFADAETCYFLEGDVTVTPVGGEPVRLGEGDLVTFPKGMACVWKVHTPVRKHYTFD